MESASLPAGRDLHELARKIDHTLLRPEATALEIDQLCAEALHYGFASVSVHGIWVRRCAERLVRSPVVVCAVVGFPHGATTPDTKVFEARRAIQDGALEIDMVLAIGSLKGRDDAFVHDDIAGVVGACHGNGAKLKVILETALLTEEEKVRACEIAKAAGVDFVKTSTGFSKSGATLADVALMRRVVGPNMGVKAAGGIRDEATARAMLRAGASRIGTSNSVRIVGGRTGGTDY